MAKRVEIKLVRSTICCPEWMRTIVRTLGLKKMHGKVVQPDNPAIWGMVNKVSHLVSARVIEVKA